MDKIPKPKMTRNFSKEGNKIKITANEEVVYTQEQLDQVYKSLLTTKQNIESQQAGAKKQKEQLENHVLPNMAEKLKQIESDVKELKKHVSADARNFNPSAQGGQPVPNSIG